MLVLITDKHIAVFQKGKQKICKHVLFIWLQWQDALQFRRKLHANKISLCPKHTCTGWLWGPGAILLAGDDGTLASTDVSHLRLGVIRCIVFGPGCKWDTSWLRAHTYNSMYTPSKFPSRKTSRGESRKFLGFGQPSQVVHRSICSYQSV